MNKKYDPEAARIWGVILKSIRELRSTGATLDQIGKLLGVGRDTVSRWLREERGGERTPVSDVLRYMHALSIHPADIFGEAAYPPPSEVDKQVAKILKGTADAQAWEYSDLAISTRLSEEEVKNYLEGRISFTADVLYKMCKVLSQDLSAIVERAVVLVETSSEIMSHKRSAI
ncbi:putative Transcriptional regulator, XRE family [Maridesulfovibrio hydrothermalis AM13 = DSM 14728]|uniref:Putative Transcriptional regulator, XRE family n=2 Tax=Maridesulfovibrio TaxID=2794998 RepID=L0RCU3_9BACT|nr:putative Transcriptional regulator, XRE family [Maridesulfovibrio hydrothermalis AM13 = DSM 14728]